ncbi:hypothetical protein U9M48_016483 [Paspalum notatum var. saurae]|uniref:Uncharacterized protein n=1 Tax=Paspalum notatum var. saurae TaxID=547442 RepID=A0AAQ3WN55_PASNO
MARIRIRPPWSGSGPRSHRGGHGGEEEVEAAAGRMRSVRGGKEAVSRLAPAASRGTERKEATDAEAAGEGERAEAGPASSVARRGRSATGALLPCVSAPQSPPFLLTLRTHGTWTASSSSKPAYARPPRDGGGSAAIARPPPPALVEPPPVQDVGMGLAAAVRSSGSGVGLRRRQAADAGKQQHGTGSGDAEQATHASSNAGKRCRLAADKRAYTWSTTKKYFIAAASPPPRSGHHGTPPPPADVLNCLSSAPNWISESSEFDIREIEMVSRSK